MRPTGQLFGIVRVHCKLRRIEVKMWEARNTEGFFWATQARGVERCIWEQASGSEWATADGTRNAAAAVAVSDGVLLGEADAWQERNNGADDDGRRARPGV